MLRILAALCLSVLCGQAAADVRIKDITNVQGVRENQLVGYGLIVGLAGSGDSPRNSPFTEQSMRAMLSQMGVNVNDRALRTRNTAAVMVTAELPPFIGRGARIDVHVSSLGDAGSLMGGTLIMTQLLGPDGYVYAVAQGPVSVSGFAAEGEAETVTQGVATSGRIPGGAFVEQEVPGEFSSSGALVLELKNPDFGTAIQIVDAVNAYTQSTYGMAAAREQDLRTVLLNKPANVGPARFIAEIGKLEIRPDAPARVVIDERSGTVVIGSQVQISTVAVTHGTLTVRITETPAVSQPLPLADGETVVVPQTFIDTEQDGGTLAIMGGADLQMLVQGLNQIGLKPTGIIAILQAIKSAGALQAELVIQ